MKFRSHCAAFVIAGLAVLGAGFSARAENVRIFRMADGYFYEPVTGLRADSEAALQSLLEARGFSAVQAETSMPISSEGPVSATLTLIDAVRQARSELQARLDAASTTKPVIVTSDSAWVDVTLAVWNARTGDIRYVDLQKNGTKLKLPDASQEFSIKVKSDNGVNTAFAFSSEEYAVVAARFPIFKDVSVSKKKPKYELHDVIYTPYSPSVHTPEMVAWGKETLHAQIAAAYETLRSSGVRSRAFPDQLLVDVIDPKLVEAIAIIEHVGLAALSGPNAQVATDAFYVVLAGNQQDAYAYAKSSAGARGLVQFIPSTYALMAKRPELGLIRDFERGMTDPVNAIKAQTAYLDAILATMPLAVKDLHNVDPLRVDEYLGAAYNTGETRVKRSITQWGDAWSEPHDQEVASLAKQRGTKSAAVQTLKKTILLPETMAYVKKLRQAVRVLNPIQLPEA